MTIENKEDSYEAFARLLISEEQAWQPKAMRDLAAAYLETRSALSNAASDTARLDALEKACSEGCAPSVIYDDNGNWAVGEDGTQSIRTTDGAPLDITHWVEAEAFRPTIREAIDAWMATQEAPK